MAPGLTTCFSERLATSPWNNQILFVSLSLISYPGKELTMNSPVCLLDRQFPENLHSSTGKHFFEISLIITFGGNNQTFS